MLVVTGAGGGEYVGGAAVGRAFRRGNQSRRQVLGLQLLGREGGRKGARDAHRDLAVRDGGGIGDSRGVWTIYWGCFDA